MSRDRLVSLDSREAARILGDLATRIRAVPRGMELVVVRALNRSITAMRDEMSVTIRETYAVRARDVKATMQVRKASRSYPIASLKARGRMSIPLGLWSARQTKKGVTVGIRKGEKRKRVVTSQGRPVVTFMAKGEVFARPELAARTNIRRLYGPSFLAVLGTPQAEAARQERAEHVFATRVVAEANHLLTGVKA